MVWPVSTGEERPMLQNEDRLLFILADAIIAALMLLAADNLTELLVEHQLDALLLLLLTLLLIRVLVFRWSGMEDLGLHLEQLIQRDAILGILGLDLLRHRFPGR